jgi:hypothetical protein
MLERWRVLPPNSPKNAVAAIGLGVRKVVMKGKDPIHAAQHFLEENPTDFVVLAAHTHKGRMRWGRGKVLSQTDRQRLGSRSTIRSLWIRRIRLSRRWEPVAEERTDSGRLDAEPRAAIEAAQRLTWALQCPEVTFTLLHVGKTGEMPSVKTEEQDGWTWRKLTRDGEVVDTILSTAKRVSAGPHRHDDGRPRRVPRRSTRFDYGAGAAWRDGAVLAIPAAMTTRGGAVVM